MCGVVAPLWAVVCDDAGREQPVAGCVLSRRHGDREGAAVGIWSEPEHRRPSECVLEKRAREGESVRRCEGAWETGRVDCRRL